MHKFRQSVGHALTTILPDGSNVIEGGGAPAEVANAEDVSPKWAMAPFFPTDVFAAAGYLCKVGGVLPFFDPDPFECGADRCQFGLNERDREAADDAGKLWRDQTDRPRAEWWTPPPLVHDLWATLIDHWHDTVTPGEYVARENGPPDWWRAALLLMMISDMACNRLLRDKLKKHPQSPFDLWIAALYAKERVENRDRTADGHSAYRPPASLSYMADTAVACVLPKVRVAPVGATLRNVSRNLSLLPGRGEVRCHWDTPVCEMPTEDDQALDILLIPEPRSLRARNFRQHETPGKDNSEKHYWKKDWEFFTLDMDWARRDSTTRDDFVNDCEALMAKAKTETRTVNGVILPELAVDYDLFDDICTRLKKKEPDLEFVIAGSHDNCRADPETGPAEPGNHVLTRIWYRGDDGDRDEKVLTVSRAKHHRWRMDRSQVETYALSPSLNPKIKHWWEKTPLGRRDLIFHRFRKDSVFSVLICEELARSDPCHEILRSVAPNLIFALLLDGPQIRERWPAQYASNLADDPGSAVLTFTSFGLLDRSNMQGRHPQNRSVALWKDDTGKVVQLQMPVSDKMSGILLSLWSEHVTDRTITGKNNKARAWRYANHMPITL